MRFCHLIDRSFVCTANEGRHILILIRLRWLSLCICHLDDVVIAWQAAVVV